MAAKVSRRVMGVVLAAALAGPVAAWAQDDEGLPNVFISPAGKPFRAVKGAPYPVVDWFKEADKNADGKLDHAEFIADAEAFFKVLDINHSGLLDPYDVAVYERRVAPEILGGRVRVGSAAARLWLAQYDDVPVTEGGGDDSSPQKPRTLDETMQGASPYSLLAIPEPVTAGGFDARGVVTKAAYMAQAERNFRALDENEKGYLTLDDLPLTKIQVLMGGRKGRKGRR
ncbi:MAG: hypothetical protein JSR86_10995 [Proteobacteria bacterium]|nr:hypothetical protein [Pseudomonadota bacterium]